MKQCTCTYSTKTSSALISIARNQIYCTDTATVCTDRIRTYREWHLNFDLQFTEFNTDNSYRSILQLGENNSKKKLFLSKLFRKDIGHP